MFQHEKEKKRDFKGGHKQRINKGDDSKTVRFCYCIYILFLLAMIYSWELLWKNVSILETF